MWSGMISGVALLTTVNYTWDEPGLMTLIKLNKLKGLGKKRAQSLHNKVFIKYYGIRPSRKGKKIYWRFNQARHGKGYIQH